MHSQYKFRIPFFLFIFVALFITACTAGNTQFTGQTPAGFWYGLWHGAISIITLVIHLFNESVMVYERSNAGGWYDFGFLLGVIFVWGGGCHIKCKSSVRKKRDQEWEEIGDKVEVKVMHKLKDWAEKDEGDNLSAEDKKDWDEVCEKVEKKIKRKLRDWAEKE